MILNTGSRTDIPAYYGEWFYNRIKAGHVLVRNPYYPTQVTKYLLSPEVIDAIVFCTKNPAPMLDGLSMLSSFDMLWFVTITPYGRDVEPYVPPKERVMDSFRRLSVMAGSGRMSWRYDPVFITGKYSISYHVEQFGKMAEALSGYTNQCVVSFIDLYEKTRRNFPMAFVTLEKKGPVGIVTMNRPEALNALDKQVLEDLNAVLDQVEADPEILVAVVTGAGRSFVAGADIGQMSGFTAVEGKAFGAYGNGVFLKLENLTKPTIAAVNGFALGGGCELSMACDIRIASEKAKFGQPEVGLGITPGFGGTQRLARIVGVSNAMELILTAKTIKAEEAQRIGLVSHVYPAEELMDKAIELANAIAANAQVAVRQSKAAIRRGMQTDMTTGAAFEAEAFGLCFATEDQKDAMKAFVNKEKITAFKNR